MKCLALLIATLLPILIYCQQISTDRPDITESPYIVPQNYIQFEHGFSYDWGETANSASPSPAEDYSNLQIASTLLRYGANDFIELRLEFNPTVSTVADASITGLPPIGIGLKTKLITAKGAIPQIAIVATAYPGLLATENMQPEASYYEWKLAVDHTLTDWWSIGWNFGASANSLSSPQYLYSLSFGFSLGEKAGCFLEVFGDFASVTTKAATAGNVYADAGITYVFTPALQVDFSVGNAITHGESYHVLGMGISWFVSAKPADKN